MTDSFSSWLVGLAKSFFGALWNFVTDVFLVILDVLLSAVLGLLSILPAPEFMGASNLQGTINAISPDVWFFASHFRIGECFAILGAAVAFRLGRKVVTLFQW